MKNNLFKLKIIILFILSSNNCFGKKPIDDLMKLDNKSSLIIDYANKDLEFILLEIAAFKGINVLIPQENQKLNAKVTLQLKDKINIDDAWSLTLELLSIAGYSLKKQEDVYTVIKNSSLASESLPTYINQDPPNDELPVRYLYFFENISVSDQSSDSSTKNNIESILNDMLTQPAQSNYMFVTGSNALLITDKGSIINGVMNIVKAIDKAGFSESIAVIPLRYAIASNISKVLSQLIPNQNNSMSYGPLLKKQSSIQDKYFSEDTKITTLDYSNSLVILGNKDSINQIKNFIYQYLDVPLETERSVITVVPLNYLDAGDFAPILQNLITSNIGQNSQSTSSTPTIGLQNAIIVAENQSQSNAQNQGQPAGPAGGNNLLIAARKQDIKMITSIIEQMDKPEPQVILEAVIVDLTQTQLRGLGFLDTRSPNNPYNPSLIKWQGNTQGAGGSAVLNYISADGTLPSCTGGTINSAYGLAADLLAPCQSSSGLATNLVTQDLTPGTLLMSFSNGCGGVAALLEMFDQYGISNDFRDPFIVTKNNQKASITSSETRIVQGATQQESTGGPIVINQEQLTASLKLEVTPRIAYDDTVNLDVNVEVSTFPSDASSGDNTIDRRVVQTSANLKSGEILVIGGVSKSNSNESVFQSPFAKVPLLGWLFKSQNKRIDNKSIYIFISPIIIRKAASIGTYYEDTTDRLNQGKEIDKNIFTNRKINHIREAFKLEDQNLYGTNLEGLRDPITKIFFSPNEAASQKAGNYIPLR